MDGLNRFFLPSGTSPDQLLVTSHDAWLVLLSVLVAVITAYVALSLSDRARDTPLRSLRLGALAAGALSLGGGVWTMHFIGMLAFQFCGEVNYDPLWTLGSMLPSLGAAWAALRGLTRRHVSAAKLLWGGVWMGSGIGLMHYGGMAAVRSSAQLRYAPEWFGASIVVAVVLSTWALWLHHRLRLQRHWDPRLRTLLTATILGGAISGMHYTAMGAARFVGVADAAATTPAPLNTELALGVALIGLVVSVIAVGFNAALVQRQLRRDRAHSEGRLQALVDTAVDGVVRMDGDGVIVAANRAAEQIFGLPEATLVGRPLAHWVPVLQTLGADFAGVTESTARRSDGEEIRLRLSVGHSVRGGERQSVAFVSDITEAQRRQAELEGVQAAIRRALVVIEFDMDGRVLRANDAFLALTGHSAESLLGQHHSVLCTPADAASPAYAALWAALRRGEFRTGDFERVGRDGRQIWIHATYNPILNAHGQPIRVIKFVNDLTERHVMEQDLRQAKLRAEQAAAAKSTFLANMSHEIRTPMNAIIGFSEVALDGTLPPDARQHLQVIDRSARALLGLLNDILDTAKLDHGAVELELQDFSLRQLCGDVLATLQMGADRKGLALNLAVAPSVPAFHRGDPTRLRQILLNLVGNAVKFTERGSVTLAAQWLERSGDLEVSVQDTGIGIAADRLERIFDPFAQADASMTRRFGGTGLGTTIARQLVQLMGGEIGVSSTPGTGSRFWIRLPLAAGSAHGSAATPDQATVRLPPLRILAADDVPENLRLLEIKLGGLGHTVSLARDGQEALTALQAGGYDIALLDVQMPHLDGLQACRLLRAHEHRTGAPRLPVLALTASASDDDRTLTGEAGMDGFAVKPIDWRLLLREMARVLGVAGDATAAAAADAPPDRAVAPDAALPETVDWAMALSGWGDVATWRTHLARFVAQQLQHWPHTPHDAALAHRLRGTSGSFGLNALAAHCAALERDPQAGEHAWADLHQRLQAWHLALSADTADPPGSTHDAEALAPWPAQAAAALHAALARGEMPEADLQAVLDALPGPQRDRLRDAIDSFDFDAAQALISRHAQEQA